MQYTQAQQDAISSRNCNLLVSAAAGSGKTAVLAARVVSLAREGVPLERMLVMTFTRSAAAEMRARILESLYAQGLREQALRVERADITTLHGFCGQVCRAYFEAADVDPLFRVGEGPEVSLLREAALSEALEALYGEPTPGFAYASLCLSQQQLADAVLQLHTVLTSRPDPVAWLRDSLALHALSGEALARSPFGRALCRQAAVELENAAVLFRRALALAGRAGSYERTAQSDCSLVQAYLAAAGDPQALLGLPRPSFARKPPRPKNADPQAEAEYAARREAGKDAVKRAMEWLEPLRDPEAAASLLREGQALLEGVADAAARFDAIFLQKKAERNLLDFSDLERRALKALGDARVQADLRARYRYVFVDEYQDSSLLQEALINRVRGEDNLFLVGDVKQSIYRFRQAQPALFLHKLRTFSAEDGVHDRKIALNANFRSSPAILHAINDVFASVFTGEAMEIEYPQAEQLFPGVPDAAPGAEPELLVLCGDAQAEGEEDALSPQEREKTRQEAEAIARRIEALRAQDPSLRLRDIAVLMRSVKGRAPQIIDVLRAHGIPAVTELGEDLLAQPEVQSALAILRVMDNARQDVPLVAALRGPALGLDAEALAKVRERTPDGPFEAAVRAYLGEDDALAGALRGFYARVDAWRSLARTVSLEKVIYRIYDETGLYARAGALERGAQRQNRLRMLAELAEKYDRERSGGLSGFLRMIERISARESLEARALAEDEDVVRVTTVHKSKGLQYPVVFVAGAGNRFGAARDGLLALHDGLGAAAPAVNPYLRAQSPTVATQAIAACRHAEDVAEEARILYVALTRAERRLFVVGMADKGRLDAWRGGYGPPPAGANCFLDWIAPVAFASKSWRTQVYGLFLPSEPRQATDINALLDPLLCSKGFADTDDRMMRAFASDVQPLRVHPLKQGVTARVRAALREGEEEALPRLRNAPRRPAFLEEAGLTGAERGSAVHTFLQLVPLEASDPLAQRDALAASGALTPAQAASLPVDALRDFFASPLWQRIRASSHVRRELLFSHRAEEDGKRILLQGVIDCCFLEEGEWVLIDYKTEARPVDEATLAAYMAQLRFYRKALEEITGTRVKETLLYFLLQRKNIIVPRETMPGSGEECFT